MTFSGCESYHKDTYDYNEHKAIQYIRVFVDKAVYIIQFDKTICTSLKTICMKRVLSYQ